jgi:hypothetical protein
MTGCRAQRDAHAVVVHIHARHRVVQRQRAHDIPAVEVVEEHALVLPAREQQRGLCGVVGSAGNGCSVVREHVGVLASEEVPALHQAVVARCGERVLFVRGEGDRPHRWSAAVWVRVALERRQQARCVVDDVIDKQLALRAARDKALLLFAPEGDCLHDGLVCLESASGSVGLNIPHNNFPCSAPCA